MKCWLVNFVIREFGWMKWNWQTVGIIIAILYNFDEISHIDFPFTESSKLNSPKKSSEASSPPVLKRLNRPVEDGDILTVSRLGRAAIKGKCAFLWVVLIPLWNHEWFNEYCDNVDYYLCCWLWQGYIFGCDCLFLKQLCKTFWLDFHETWWKVIAWAKKNSFTPGANLIVQQNSQLLFPIGLDTYLGQDILRSWNSRYMYSLSALLEVKPTNLMFMNVGEKVLHRPRKNTISLGTYQSHGTKYMYCSHMIYCCLLLMLNLLQWYIENYWAYSLVK